MKFRLRITKKLILRLLLFTGVLVVTMMLDNYFDHNSIKIKTEDNEPQQSADEYAAVYILGQNSSVAAKNSEQNFSYRKLLEQHVKNLQRYHESKNFRKFKTKLKEPKIPLFLSFHHLLFRHHAIPVPKDEPHLS